MGYFLCTSFNQEIQQRASIISGVLHLSNRLAFGSFYGSYLLYSRY